MKKALLGLVLKPPDKDKIFRWHISCKYISGNKDKEHICFGNMQRFVLVNYLVLNRLKK